jgi:hypothetical protein
MPLGTHRPECARDLYAAYQAMYEALAQHQDGCGLLADARSTRRCWRVRSDCALVQAMIDVRRGAPKRPRGQFAQGGRFPIHCDGEGSTGA